MTLPLVLLRPEPGWSASAEMARAMGIEVAGAPLFAVEPVAWQAADPDAFDALLIGSGNAFRYGAGGLARLRDLPVHAVGAATAAAAREAGFAIAGIGAGGLQAVLDRLEPPLRLLRLAGAAHVALRAPEGIAIETRIVYRVRALALPEATCAVLRAGAVVALHSAEAAQHFANELTRCGIDRAALALAVLGPRIAAAAGAGWGAIHIADRPSEAALLAMARQMCHTPT